jgi:hypothetical protein
MRAAPPAWQRFDAVPAEASKHQIRIFGTMQADDYCCH